MRPQRSEVDEYRERASALAVMALEARNYGAKAELLEKLRIKMQECDLWAWYLDTRASKQ